MKLSTMLLPTGEFAIIASEVPRNIGDRSAWVDQFKTFRERAGAAAGWVTDLPVEVENALIDEGAIRANVDEEPWSKWLDVGQIVDDKSAPNEDFRRATFQQIHIPRAKMPDSDESFSVTFTAEGDDNLLKTLYGGADFSPAGLVKDGPKVTVSEAELIGVPFTPTERRARGFTTDGVGVTTLVEPVDITDLPPSTSPASVSTDPNAERVVGRFPYFGPQNHDIIIDDMVISDPEALLPDPFPIGTRVKIIGPSYWGMDAIGQVGTVLEPSIYTPDGHVCVGDLEQDGFEDCRWFYHPANLQPVPVDLHDIVADAKAKMDAAVHFEANSLDRVMADLLEDINIVRSVN